MAMGAALLKVVGPSAAAGAAVISGSPALTRVRAATVTNRGTRPRTRVASLADVPPGVMISSTRPVDRWQTSDALESPTPARRNKSSDNRQYDRFLPRQHNMTSDGRTDT